MIEAPVIDAENATKRYGEVLGLNGFSARFAPGITALIGPNGAGKSTFFRLLVGQLRLDGGRLTVLGKDPWSSLELHREIGYCPESPNVYGWMSAYEFVSYLLRLDGFDRSAAEDRAARGLAEVGLSASAARRLRGFSKGMRQRVKLAQAIAHDPRLLLLDEPLNGLDPVGRFELIDLFRKLAKAGRHLVVSSHVLYEVERLTEEVVILTNGRVIAQGNLHRLRDAIDDHPHTILLRSPDPRRLGERLARRLDVSSVEFLPTGEVSIRTQSPDRFYSEFPRLVVDEDLPVTSMSSPDDNLESVFRFLSEGAR